MNVEDLLTVIEHAEAWAGEYGYAVPQEATDVYSACERLRASIALETPR